MIQTPEGPQLFLFRWVRLEAVRWFLQSYATDEVIHQAVLSLHRARRKKPSEDEINVYIFLKDAASVAFISILWTNR